MQVSWDTSLAGALHKLSSKHKMDSGDCRQVDTHEYR